MLSHLGTKVTSNKSSDPVKEVFILLLILFLMVDRVHPSWCLNLEGYIHREFYHRPCTIRDIFTRDRKIYVTLNILHN